MCDPDICSPALLCWTHVQSVYQVRWRLENPDSSVLRRRLRDALWEERLPAWELGKKLSVIIIGLANPPLHHPMELALRAAAAPIIGLSLGALAPPSCRFLQKKITCQTPRCNHRGGHGFMDAKNRVSGGRTDSPTLTICMHLCCLTCLLPDPNDCSLALYCTKVLGCPLAVCWLPFGLVIPGNAKRGSWARGEPLRQWDVVKRGRPAALKLAQLLLKYYSRQLGFAKKGGPIPPTWLLLEIASVVFHSLDVSQLSLQAYTRW